MPPLLARRLLAGLALAGVAACGGPTHRSTASFMAGIRPTPLVLDCGGNHAARRPAVILFACGDGAVSAEVSWTSWTSLRAQGQGSVVVDDCKPNCATGRPIRYPALFTLRVPVQIRGAPYFTALDVLFTAKSPGRSHTLSCRMAVPGAGDANNCLSILYG
jgi:hypothetical protein